MRVLIPEDIAAAGKDYLSERGYDLKVGCSTDLETLKRELAQVDAVIVRNARYPREVFEQSKRLKVIARHGTGTDNIDVAAAQELGIQVVNGPLANINTVAEYVIAQMMALATGLIRADQRTRSADWSYRLSMKRLDVEGRTLGLIGYGNIGRLVAQKALGLGMKVMAYDVRTDLSDKDGVRISKNLDEVLENSDFVSVHVPSNPGTRGMFCYDRFKKMKKGSYFINDARGDTYIEEDLIRVLEEGHLSGAALDVYSEEPLCEGPLFQMEQVILSQHNAGLSENSKEKMSLYAAMGVDEVLSGRKPSWPVKLK